MWILPKQLHTLESVRATGALSLDSKEFCQLCAQSLTVRSKVLPVQTWSRKWKLDAWMQLLYGRTLKPSHGTSFETEWTSSLEATPVSHSVQPVTEKEKTTQDTFGRGSQMELGFSDQNSVCLKMLKDTFRWDSPQSSVTWRSLVTLRRGEYSQRLSAARHTSESVSLSWPTAATRDHKGGYEGGRIRDGRVSMDTLDVAVQAYTEGGILAASWPTPTVQEAGKIGNQANHGQVALSNHPAIRGCVEREKLEKSRYGQAVPVNRSTYGNRPESLETPKQNLKLNSRWVEALMGLPIGWVMPSFRHPATTE